MPIPAVLVVGVGTSLGSVFLFGKLADEILEHESMALDKRLVEDAREMRSPTLDRAMSVATALGEPWALGSAGAVVGLAWLIRASQGRCRDLGIGSARERASQRASEAPLPPGASCSEAASRPRNRLQLPQRPRDDHRSPPTARLPTWSARRGNLTKHPVARLVWAPVLLVCTLVGVEPGLPGSPLSDRRAGGLACSHCVGYHLQHCPQLHGARGKLIVCCSYGSDGLLL